MLRTGSSVRSHHGAAPRSPRERTRRSTRNEQLAALIAAFKRTQLEPDSNAGSSVASTQVTNVSTVSRSPGYYAYEPSETSEVSDTSTVCWSDYEGSIITRRPRPDSSAVSASRPPGGGPTSYEPSEISEVSDQSTVCWSDYEGSNTTPPSTRHPRPNPDRSNAEPASLPRETFLPISDINDFSAIQIILALIHDCLLAVDNVFHGHRPPNVFEHRYRLLSLYIVADDVSAFRRPLQLQGFHLRYLAIEKLLELRQKTLFATGEELNLCLNSSCRNEIHTMRDIIEYLRQEPLGNVFSDDDWISFQRVLGKIDSYLTDHGRPSEWVDIISRDIRSFLDIRPFRDVVPFNTFTEVTPAREVAMLNDILFGLWGIHTKAFSGPSDTQFISLTDDSRRTPYSDERRMRHIRQLVLCRDVVCGVLPGPSPMTMRGAYTTYLRPVLSVSRQLYGFWAALPSQESAELENYIKTFFIVTYEERMDWCKDFQLMALHTMMNHFTDLHKRYFSPDSTA